MQADSVAIWLRTSTHRGDITVREFVSEFCGLTGTAKQKEVLAETGASHVSLHNFFGLRKAIPRTSRSCWLHSRSTASRCNPLSLASLVRNIFSA